MTSRSSRYMLEKFKVTKIIFLILFLILFSFLNCNNNRESEKSKTIDLLSVAYSNSLAHLQTQNEILYFKKNKVKSISFVVEADEFNKADSITFLTYNRNGRLITRTTSECSSMGCLPYEIQQKFIYSNDTLIAMLDYFFKYKKKSTLKYWQTKDTSRLRFAYDELYTHKGDTTIVDLMHSIRKYIKDDKGRIIQIETDAKFNDQYSKSNIVYTDSTIIQTNKSDMGEGVTEYSYNKMDNSIEQRETSGDGLIEWVIDSKGLFRTKNYYKDGKIRKKVNLSYSFYSQ